MARVFRYTSDAHTVTICTVTIQQQQDQLQPQQGQEQQQQQLQHQPTNDVYANAVLSTTMVQSEPEDDESINCVSNQTHNNTRQHMDAWFVSRGLHICHLNVHYLYPKLDEIKILLHEQKNIDIFCLGETFLNDQYFDAELNIPNCNFVRSDRQSNGGGLIIYSQPSLQRQCLSPVLCDVKVNLLL